MQILAAPPREESAYCVVDPTELDYRATLFNRIGMRERIVIAQLLRHEAESRETEIQATQYELRGFAIPCAPGFKPANQVFRVFLDPLA